jgi:SAM-dependent methyltransferase
MARVSDVAFWEDLYARGGDGWELRAPAPALVDFVQTSPPPRGRVLVPGCGRGHDARFLAAHGYDVVAVDFSSAALSAARALARRDRVDVEFEQRDLFTLADDHARAFDGIWEYTSFVAIDPARRSEYVRMLAAVLRPGGWLLGCFFPLRSLTPGPPFPVSRAEVHRRLRRHFTIAREYAPLRSPRWRQGREWLVHAVRTSDR